MKNFDSLTEFEVLQAITVDYSQLFDDFVNTPSSLKCIYKQIYHTFKQNDTSKLDLKIFKNLSEGLNSDVINGLSDFYINIRTKSNNLCTRIFIYNLSKKYGVEIDFRKLKLNSYPILLNGDLDQIKSLFDQLYSSKIRIKPPKAVNKWFKWPDSSYKYGKHRFLKYQDCVVAFDGSLVPINNLTTFKSRFFIKRSAHYKSLIDHHPDLIDGIKLNQDKIPLISLKHDLLTGLELSEELPKFIKIIHKHNISMMEVPSRKRYFIENLPPQDRKIVNKALNRLKFTIAFIDELAQFALQNKFHVMQPSIFVTQGGSGSGKSILYDLANNITSGNLVEASLDKARYHSLIYTLMVKCEHHCDDYAIISQFAYTLRDTTLNYALAKNFNLLLDGTGIPYKNRYDHLIEIFKHSGYKTHILGVNAEFFRNGDNDAYGRIIQRFKGKTDHRALPWKVALLKHHSQPKAFLNAIDDDNLDHAIMIDSIHPITSSYILAIVMVVTEDELQQLNNHIYEVIKCNPTIKTSTFKFPIHSGFKIHLIKKTKTEYKVLLISNLDQFNKCMHKCLINFNSMGEEDLYFNNYKYLIPCLDLTFDTI